MFCEWVKRDKNRGNNPIFAGFLSFWIKSRIMSQQKNLEKSRYSDEELKEFEAIIDEKLEKAKNELNYYLDQRKALAENSDAKIKGLDDGLTSAENERLSTMASRQEKLIKHLENAKIRIQNKVYGICRETGKLISKERLRAVPHATLSIEAKKRN